MKILIKTLKGLRLIETKNIVYCQADEHYTKIYTNKNIDTKEYFISILMLKYFEENLPEINFFRCHKSFLFNLDYFKEFDAKRNIIILKNNSEIKISRNKKLQMQKKLFTYIEYKENHYCPIKIKNRECQFLVL